MPLDSFLSRHFIFPASDYVKGINSLDYLKYLNKTQWLKSDELKQIQETNLRKMVFHAYNNVPYYRKLFNEKSLKPSDIKTVDDLSKIPILTKDIIREHGPELVSTAVSKKYRNTSGGTTGDPLVSYKDLNTISCSLSSAYRGWSWGGYSVGDRYATLWRSPDTINKYSSISNKIQNVLRRNLLLNCFDIENNNLYKHAVKLNSYNPRILRASPSAGFAMAKFIESEYFEKINPTAFFTAAEKLYAFQRKKIESVFSCDVFDSYGSNEVRSMAYECEEHSGYHISIENVVLEFLSEDERVSPGELGKIVITDLTNFAMPFLRYEIGDIGVPCEDECSCGRGLPLVRSIEGRYNSFVQTKENKLFSSSFFADLLIDSGLVENFQIIQNDFNNINLYIDLGSKCTTKDDIILTISNYLYNFNINAKIIDKIEPAKSGKLQLVICNI